MYLLPGVLSEPQANAVHTECWKELALTLLSDPTKELNALQRKKKKKKRCQQQLSPIHSCKNGPAWID